MTLSVEVPRHEYTAAAAQTTFPYTFKLFDATDIEVAVDGAVVASSTYNITGVGQPGGGNVVFVAPLAGGESVILRADVPYTQPTTYTENDPFPAASHEEGLDRTVRLTQQLRELSDRTLRLDPSLTVPPTSTLLLPSTTAAHFLRRNATDDGFDWVLPGNAEVFGTTYRQVLTATAGQTVFTLATPYAVDLNQLHVYVNGVYQGPGTLTETSPTTFTMSAGLDAGDRVDCVVPNFNPVAPAVTSGTGSPEGVVTAAIGSLYTDTTGGAGSTLYVKESGAGNTGWGAK